MIHSPGDFFSLKQTERQGPTEALLAPGHVLLLLCLGQAAHMTAECAVQSRLWLSCLSPLPPHPMQKVTSLKFSCRHLNCIVVMGCPQLSATPKGTETKTLSLLLKVISENFKAYTVRLFSVGNAYRGSEIIKRIKAAK